MHAIDEKEGDEAEQQWARELDARVDADSLARPEAGPHQLAPDLLDLARLQPMQPAHEHGHEPGGSWARCRRRSPPAACGLQLQPALGHRADACRRRAMLEQRAPGGQDAGEGHGADGVGQQALDRQAERQIGVDGAHISNLIILPMMPRPRPRLVSPPASSIQPRGSMNSFMT